MSEEITRIRHVYDTTYRPKPGDRSYIWHPRNPVSVFFRQAQERALIALFNDYDIPLEAATVLDVGCGTGRFLRFLASLGVPPEGLHGLDLMPYRLRQARLLSPVQAHLAVGNAAVLPYPDASFSLVSQFTVFSSIFDPCLRRQTAREMERVLKPGSFLLWYDMRSSKSRTTQGIEKKEIEGLFPSCTIRSIRKLHPYRATWLARRSWRLSELWDWIAGPIKTHYLALLLRS